MTALALPPDQSAALADAMVEAGEIWHRETRDRLALIVLRLREAARNGARPAFSRASLETLATAVSVLLDSEAAPEMTPEEIEAAAAAEALIRAGLDGDASQVYHRPHERHRAYR